MTDSNAATCNGGGFGGGSVCFKGTSQSPKYMTSPSKHSIALFSLKNGKPMTMGWIRLSIIKKFARNILGGFPMVNSICTSPELLTGILFMPTQIEGLL